MTRAALAVLGLLVLAPSAAAADPGVTVDPSSPAGSEYQLPLDAARGDLSGSGGSQSHSGSGGSNASGGGSSPSGQSSTGDTSSSSTLFGAGVGDSRVSSGKKRKSGGGSGGGSGSSGSGGSPASPSNTVKAAATRPLSASDGGSATLPLIGAAAGLLLAGGAAGLVIRRRAQP